MAADTVASGGVGLGKVGLTMLELSESLENTAVSKHEEA
jgi:hypothetical protein